MALPEWERALFLLVQSVHADWADALMGWFSGAAPWVLLVPWLFWGMRAKPRREAMFLLVSALLLVAVVDSSTSYFFKNAFKRIRPCKMPGLREFIPQFGQGCGGKWGFFSSHAANAAAVVHFFLPFTVLTRLQSSLLWAFAVLIAFSRVYLGAHLPLDVMVGTAWGLALAHVWRAWVASALRARGAP